MQSFFSRQPSIHTRQTLVAMLFVLGGIPAAEAAPQKTTPPAAGQQLPASERLASGRGLWIQQG